jgi:hypothetical protein
MVASKAMAEPAQITVENREWKLGAPHVGNLLSALRRLDRLLEKAIASAQAVYGPQAAIDPFRGLHISQEEVAQLLTRLPGVPWLYVEEESQVGSELETSNGIAPLTWLAKELDLSPFDLDLIIIALAPELDLRYERLYAYLQDDVSRRRPSVDLALNLLCPSIEAKLMRRSHFGSQAPLIRHSLLHLIPDPNQVQPPLLSHYLKLDEQVTCLLLSQKTLHPTIAPFSRLVEPAISLDELVLSMEVRHALVALLVQAREEHQPLRLHFYGPHGTGKRSLAEALAGLLNMPLLVLDLLEAFNTSSNFELVLKLVFREAWYQDALLYLDKLEALSSDELAIQRLAAALASSKGIIILSGLRSRIPATMVYRSNTVDVISVPFPIPSFTARRLHWQTALEDAAFALDAQGIDDLASRFLLTPGQITDAVITARNYALWRSVAQSAAPNQAQAPIYPTLSDLFAAARGQTSQEIEHSLTKSSRALHGTISYSHPIN